MPHQYHIIDLNDFFKRNKFYAERLRRLASRVELIQHSLSRVNLSEKGGGGGGGDEQVSIDLNLRQTIKDLKLRRVDLERVYKEETDTEQHNHLTWKDRQKLWSSIPNTILLNPENEYLTSQDPNFYDMGDRKWVNPLPLVFKIRKLCHQIYNCFHQKHSFAFIHNNIPSREIAGRIITDFLNCFLKNREPEHSQDATEELQQKTLQICQLSCLTCNIKFKDISLANNNIWDHDDDHAYSNPTDEQLEYEFKVMDQMMAQNVQKMVNNINSPGHINSDFDPLDDYEKKIIGSYDSSEKFFDHLDSDNINLAYTQGYMNENIIQTIVDTNQLEALKIQNKVREINMQETNKPFQGKYSVNPEVCQFPGHIQNTPELDQKIQRSILKKVDFFYKLK